MAMLDSRCSQPATTGVAANQQFTNSLDFRDPAPVVRAKRDSVSKPSIFDIHYSILDIPKTPFAFCSLLSCLLYSVFCFYWLLLFYWPSAENAGKSTPVSASLINYFLFWLMPIFQTPFSRKASMVWRFALFINFHSFVNITVKIHNSTAYFTVLSKVRVTAELVI